MKFTDATEELGLKDVAGVSCALADVRLVDAKGKTTLRRAVGIQVLTGCRGPNAVKLAVREPGEYTLRVRFADGNVEEQKITVGRSKHVKVAVTNDRPGD